MSLVSIIQSAITEDATRSGWSLSEWRAYLLESVVAVPKGTRLTRKTLLAALGPLEGVQVFDALTALSPTLAEEMRSSEGGVDITHPQAAQFIESLVKGKVATEDQIATVMDVLKQSQTRAAYHGVGDPKERYIRAALQELNV